MIGIWADCFMRSVLMITKSQQNRGSYMRLYPLANHLSTLGNEITLLCPHERPQATIEVRRVNNNFKLILLPRFATRTHFAGMMYRALRSIPFLVETKYDLIHCCSPAFPDTWLPLFMGKLKHIPILVDLDDLWGFDGDGRRTWRQYMVRS